ncbi:hypothetical protein ABZ379_26455 [Streptomyces canus]|uniref:hypothetical protein n=1 Tax=Streptomyces canus TaxID=58343 RepID=UPI0033DB809B
MPAPHSPVPGLSNPTPVEAGHVSIQPQIDYYLYGGLAATEQVLPGMIERGSATISCTTGGSSMDPMAGPAESTATAIVSGALRTYALKLHQATAGTGVYVAHVPIFVRIGTGGPETPKIRTCQISSPALSTLVRPSRAHARLVGRLPHGLTPLLTPRVTPLPTHTGVRDARTPMCLLHAPFDGVNIVLGATDLLHPHLVPQKEPHPCAHCRSPSTATTAF